MQISTFAELPAAAKCIHHSVGMKQRLPSLDPYKAVRQGNEMVHQGPRWMTWQTALSVMLRLAMDY